MAPWVWGLWVWDPWVWAPCDHSGCTFTKRPWTELGSELISKKPEGTFPLLSLLSLSGVVAVAEVRAPG